MTACRGWIFDPDRQGMVPTNNPQHKFSLTTRRCVRCNLHEFHLPAVPNCTAEAPLRRVVEDGVIVEGPEA
jgi:hypothetical protein